MRRFLLCSVVVSACGGGQTNSMTDCPNLGQVGECSGTTAKWCEGSGPTATTLDCSTLNGVCLNDPAFAAWCAVGQGQPCTATTDTDRAGYFYCATDGGVDSSLACDLDTGCTASQAICQAGESFPICSGDSLVIDCTPWGQPVQRLCTGSAIGGTTCSNGACVGVAAGKACGALAVCADGYICDPTSNTCLFQTAPHGANPQVVSAGGHTLANPKVMVINWDSNAVQAAVASDFVTQMAASSYWATTTSEYGVGPLTVVPGFTLTGTPPVGDAAVVAILEANTTGAEPAWGPADPNTFYVFNIPAGTTFDDGTDSRCCVDYDGYHYEAVVSSKYIPYAIVCTCPGFDDTENFTLDNAQQLTVVMSHELTEGVADPHVGSSPAYWQADDAHAAWSIVTEGEIADMCEFLPDYPVPMPGSTYTAQRIWSNASMTMGNNPCVPVSAALYAGTEPVLPDTARVGNEIPTTTNVIKIAIGSTGVVDVPLWSNMPTTSWRVYAQDYSAVYEGGPARLKLQLDASKGNNGDVLHLTITPASFDSSIGGAVFIIESDFEGGSSLAMGIVARP